MAGRSVYNDISGVQFRKIKPDGSIAKGSKRKVLLVFLRVEMREVIAGEIEISELLNTKIQ